MLVILLCRAGSFVLVSHACSTSELVMLYIRVGGRRNRELFIAKQLEIYGASEEAP